MYLDYYNIIENPFHIDSGNTSLWLGGSLLKVSSTLKETIVERKGVIYLTGDAGTGKSTIIKMISDILQDQFIIVPLSNPEVTGLDFFNVLSASLKFNKYFNSKSAFLVHLRNFLRSSNANSKNVLLIINDVDRLKIELFGEIALLSEIEFNNRKMISILLVGQKGWLDAAMQENKKGISEKIALICNLDPLTEVETAEYIQYCLGTVGTKNKIFSDKAIHEIHSFSDGNLSLINSICDLALRKGYTYKKKRINTAIVTQCANTLNGKGTSDSDLKPPQKAEDKKEKEEKSIAEQPPSRKRWLWIKIVFVLLLIFSAYVLYKSQSEKSNIWRTDEIAHKDYDFHQLKEQEEASPNTPQELSENFSNSGAENPVAVTVPPTVENERLKPSTSQKGNISGRLSTNSREWPFSTYKKIIYFKYDSNTLSPEFLEILDEIANYAIQNPDREFIIMGYTDSTGARSYNLTISKFRANSVKNYLIAKGVEPGKLSAYGLGSQNPIFSNRTAGGRKLNRRVEIELKLE
jgi:outer membrane protein OmpA-like peptidoglycan-associated protein/type II secretory pathway predicted ATPase ExeA